MPDASDASFWGNWGDPRWREYLARRRQATGAFLEFVKQHLPENFPLMTCCTSCAYGGNNFCAQCADEMLRGDNILNLEICGDNPSDVCERLASGSHHAGTAEKHGAPVIAIGYGFHTDSAGHLWALNHMSGFSTWFSTLKGRLGLPEELLATLPDDAASIARAFAFEREHPELFCEGLLHDCAVYFSETTKTESFFGACEQGATRDYRELMRTLFTAGFRPETIFDFPGDAASCPCVLVPSAAVMRPEEAAGMEDYLNAGGIVLRFGPDSTAGYPDAPEEFESLRWLCGERFDESMLPDEWHEVRPGLFRNPSRRPGGLPEFLRKFIRNDLPAVEAPGFAVAVREHSIHLLALHYDIELDQKLEEKRLQHSHVKIIRAARAVACAEKIRCEVKVGRVHCPLGGQGEMLDDGTIRLSGSPMYVILEL